MIDRLQPLSIDLWGGGGGARSVAAELLQAGRALLADVEPQDIGLSGAKTAYVALPAAERRLLQVRSVREPGLGPVIIESRLSDMDEWAWPLHMIDFETSAPALPFFAGMRPYETLAFQFSHHVMTRDTQGRVRIRHASQWISTEAGAFPSIEFVRQLRMALMPDGHLHGTVFRYHNHENTVLRKLRAKVEASSQPDRDLLVEFIDLITKSTGEEGRGQDPGAKAMVDLHRLVQEGYYSPKAGGSISLKYILPAILHDAPSVRGLYACEGVYGRGLAIPSLNFDGPAGHVWLQERAGWNPYQTLPPVFGPEFGELDGLLSRLVGEDGQDGTIAQGGVAMTAYNFTQFAQLPPAQRKRIQEALLRYCELDTLAMVMLVQGLMELRGRPLQVV